MKTNKNNADPKDIVVERTFNAPVSRVWEVLTQKEHIKHWFFELKEFKTELGFEFKFEAYKDDIKYAHICKIVTVVPEKKLAYSWRYEGHKGDSLVTFELFAEGQKTRLKLTHSGLDNFPKVPDFAKQNFVAGWTMITGENLKQYVETDPQEIVISRVINAPRERVWEAWTNPQQVAQWWGPNGFTTTIKVMDVRPGGVWEQIMRGPDGTEYPNKSVFSEVVKPRRIVFSHGGGKKGAPGVQFVSTWSFDVEGSNKTRVTIHMVFPSTEARDKVVNEYGAIEGGRQTLARLEEHVTV